MFGVVLKMIYLDRCEILVDVREKCQAALLKDKPLVTSYNNIHAVTAHLQGIQLEHKSNVPREEIPHGPMTRTLRRSRLWERATTLNVINNGESTIPEEEHPRESEDIQGLPLWPID